MSTIEPSSIDGISYIPSDSLAPIVKKLTFKENRAFGVTDIRGEFPRGRPSELGIYFNDTRYLNIWETLYNGQTTVPLAQELRHQGTTLILSMTNRDLPLLESSGRIPRDTLLIRRILTLHEDSLFELITIRNFSGQRQTLQFEHWAGSRFEDIFEVRGMSRKSRGNLNPPSEPSAAHFILSYSGLDGRLRETHIQRFYQAQKIRLSPYLTGYTTQVVLDPKEIATFRTVVSFDHPSSLLFYKHPFDDMDAGAMMHLASLQLSKPKLFDFHIESDNAIFNRALDCAATDITMLMTQEPGEILYPYAGIPWFSAPFGRDGLITAYQLLPWAPQVAKGVLEFVFNGIGLGKNSQSFTDEEPGKVFHEFRRGEMAQLKEIPFIPYFGSVDSTPLALILLYEYLSWTQDRSSLDRWWPSILQANAWIDQYGDSDGDLLLEYARKSEIGLSNQGWKDSHDSVMHEDGSLAQAPILLCEVQAYAYRAKLGLSEISRWKGDIELANSLKSRALRLRTEFQERFWDPYLHFIILALDGNGRPCRVRSSNMGHCLWGGILNHLQAKSVSEILMSESMFSGHGIRTLSDIEAAYNPMSYHNGSVWPHDNSIIAEGFRQYGRLSDLLKLSEGLMGVLETSDDFRLPELFSGFRKRGDEPPIPYEVACKPQAWSAGSIFLVLKSLLGLTTSLNEEHVRLRDPLLPLKSQWVRIQNLQIRDGQTDLLITQTNGRTRVETKHKSGKTRLMTVHSRDW